MRLPTRLNVLAGRPRVGRLQDRPRNRDFLLQFISSQFHGLGVEHHIDALGCNPVCVQMDHGILKLSQD